MLVTCWSVKGGAGTTVVAAALALLFARRRPGGALLADVDGEAPAVLGVPEPDSAGIAGWLGAGPAVPVDALARLTVPVAPGLDLLPRAGAHLSADRADVLAAVLADGPRAVVADCGTAVGAAGDGGEVARALVDRSARSVLVIRPCYLSLRRAMARTRRPTEVVVVREAGRVLTARDVEHVVEAPVVAEVDHDPAVARSVDGGGLAGRLPRSLERALRHVA